MVGSPDVGEQTDLTGFGVIPQQQFFFLFWDSLEQNITTVLPSTFNLIISSMGMVGWACIWVVGFAGWDSK